MFASQQLTAPAVTRFFVHDESTSSEMLMDEAVSEMIREFLSETEIAVPVSNLVERFSETTIHDHPMAPEQYVESLRDDVVDHANRIASPRSLSHMSQGLPWFSRPIARLVTAMNQNLTKADASRSLTLCEREALATLHRLLYQRSDEFYQTHVQKRESTLGIVTSGGTLANLTAMWCARNTALKATGKFAGIEHEGLLAALQYYGYRDAVVIGPESMHYSFAKAIGLMGLGERNLFRVPLDSTGRVKVDVMRDAVEQCQKEGKCILAIVGVAGSTDAGAIDPLNELADLAASVGTAFHVDAAWGGPLLFSKLHATRLAGIERADTVTLDGHKQLYLPLGIGMLLFREPQRAKAIEKHANYLSRPGSDDLGCRSLEGSRSGMVLHLHAALRLFGRTGYAQLVEHGIRMAPLLCQRISHSVDFELLILKPDSNLVLYRYLPVEYRDRLAHDALTWEDQQAINQFNERLHQAQLDAGSTCVSRTTVQCTRYGQAVPLVALRAVVANPLTSAEDLEAVLNDQVALANQLSK
ncbi:MAG TPA: aminotransferase class V-fold PLP-dependent enzyme [Gemmatales bacterium]|nr:aminotransferase class V-fold PLP-dependent enzyme [Gemmatales bacterium]